MLDINTLISLRESAGFTQAELADRIGITRTAISKIEHGHRRLELPVLVAWVDACGGSLSLANPLGGLVETAVGSVRQLSPTDADIIRRVSAILPGLSSDDQATLEALITHWTVKKL